MVLGAYPAENWEDTQLNHQRQYGNETKRMRITRKILLKIAEDTVAERVRTERDLLAVYLRGSVAEEGSPLLGGTADIDLVLVHDDPLGMEREIVRLTEEVHLDIAHHTRRDYRQARQLRHQPWLGSAISGGKIMYDPRHFLDFTQASARAHFNRPDNVVARARSQAESARAIWFKYQLGVKQPGLGETAAYLEAVEEAANAMACLSGAPLPERRLLLGFPERAAKVGRAGLYAGLVGLLGGADLEAATIQTWITRWTGACVAVGDMERTPPSLHPHRLPYYRRALEAMLESERPQDSLWLLLHTWCKAVICLPADHEEVGAWQEVHESLGLFGEAFNERIAALDSFLDVVEETIERWGRERGVSV